MYPHLLRFLYLYIMPPPFPSLRHLAVGAARFPTTPHALPRHVAVAAGGRGQEPTFPPNADRAGNKTPSRRVLRLPHTPRAHAEDFAPSLAKLAGIDRRVISRIGSIYLSSSCILMGVLFFVHHWYFLVLTYVYEHPISAWLLFDGWASGSRETR